MKKATVKEFPMFHKFEGSSTEILSNPDENIFTLHRFKNGLYALISNAPYSESFEDLIWGISIPTGTSIFIQENKEHTRFAIGLLNFIV